MVSLRFQALVVQRLLSHHDKPGGRHGRGNIVALRILLRWGGILAQRLAGARRVSAAFGQQAPPRVVCGPRTAQVLALGQQSGRGDLQRLARAHDHRRQRAAGFNEDVVPVIGAIQLENDAAYGGPRRGSVSGEIPVEGVSVQMGRKGHTKESEMWRIAISLPKPSYPSHVQPATPCGSYSGDVHGLVAYDP